MAKASEKVKWAKIGTVHLTLSIPHLTLQKIKAFRFCKTLNLPESGVVNLISFELINLDSKLFHNSTALRPLTNGVNNW